MEEPSKLIMEKLAENLENTRNLISYSGRSSNRTKLPYQLLLQQILELSEKKEEITILVSSMSNSGGRVSEYQEVVEKLRELGMKSKVSIVYDSISVPIGKIPEPLILELNENKSFLLNDIIIKDLEYHDRKIPIPGKSSKKGKNNQLGSKFHK